MDAKYHVPAQIVYTCVLHYVVQFIATASYYNSISTATIAAAAQPTTIPML